VIRVFIVAPSPLTRTGLQSVIKTRNVEVVGCVANFEALADRWSDVEADIVLVEAFGEQPETVMILSLRPNLLPKLPSWFFQTILNRDGSLKR
jgi:DNA-binding NarL/FixJ family response regulator